jgi:ACR3 family arsenite transporter
MFAMQGDRIVELPLEVLLIAIPLVLYFGILFTLAFTLSRRLGFNY